MLSYRHAFHAGNHADVFKHLVLTRLVRSLLRKDKPFFYQETHAGAGRYDLRSQMAMKNREFESGIGPLWGREAILPQGLADYVDTVKVTNPGRELRWYPGSPRVVRALLRPGDRMVLAELHPTEARTIAMEFEGDHQVRVEHGDGYQTLRAYLPPRERRGLVHIDPSFELKDERRRLLQAVQEAYRRWATGIYAIWYPIQDRATADDFLRRFRKLGIPKVLLAEFCVRPEEAFRLTGSGMLVINPPWRLDEELRGLLPSLLRALGADGLGQSRIEWIADE